MEVKIIKQTKMFTGIIEEVGEVISIENDQSNSVIWLKCGFTSELKIDQSLSHNGVCLTVTAIDGDRYSVTAIKETLEKSNLGSLTPASKVNLERCLKYDGRLDGHIVQGHVDCTAKVESVNEVGGSWEIGFLFEPEPGRITVEKGSVTVNGVSLTVVKSEPGYFSVAIIPFTWEHTTFNNLKPGHSVNIEFDIIGKYVARMFSDAYSK